MTVQKRITALDTYTQLSAGDVGYIAPSAVFVAVDNSGWTESKKFSLSNFLVSNHWESSRLSGLASTAVVETFGSDMSSANYYMDIQVYKEINFTIGGASVVLREDVPYHDLVQVVGGFSLTLSEKTGTIISYFAFI